MDIFPISMSNISLERALKIASDKIELFGSNIYTSRT